MGEDDGGLDVVLDDAIGGSSAAFERIYAELAGSVASYLRLNGASDADGLANEVMLNVHTGLPRFEGDWSAFRGWVFTIAHRRAVDERRRWRRRPPVARPVVAHDGAVRDAEEDAISALGDERVRALLGDLSPDQRDVLLLRVVADLPLVQVATTLGKPVGAVKSLQHRALAALRRQVSVEEVGPWTDHPRDDGPSISDEQDEALLAGAAAGSTADDPVAALLSTMRADATRHGTPPMGPALRARLADPVAAPTTPSRRWRVVAAAALGTLLGGSVLGVAGAQDVLPAPIQDATASVFHVVGVHLPRASTRPDPAVEVPPSSTTTSTSSTTTSSTSTTSTSTTTTTDSTGNDGGGSSSTTDTTAATSSTTTTTVDDGNGQGEDEASAAPAPKSPKAEKAPKAPKAPKR